MAVETNLGKATVKEVRVKPSILKMQIENLQKENENCKREYNELSNKFDVVFQKNITLQMKILTILQIINME